MVWASFQASSVVSCFALIIVYYHNIIDHFYFSLANRFFVFPYAFRMSSEKTSFCRNCSEEGFCASRNSGCRFSHKDCRNGVQCFNPKCSFMHPQPKCANFEDCSVSGCPLRHGKRNCSHEKKPFPVKPKQSLANEVARYEPTRGPKTCISGESCLNYSCSFVHPPSRPPLCQDGADCAKRMCLRLHPAHELDKILFRKAPTGFGGYYKSISEARKAHREKMAIVSKESFRLLQQPPAESADIRDEQEAVQTAIEAQALELINQLSNFDKVVQSCLESLLPLGTSDKNHQVEDKNQKFRINAAKARLRRELFRLRLALPALGLRHEVERETNTSQFVIVQGATGSG